MYLSVFIVNDYCDIWPLTLLPGLLCDICCRTLSHSCGSSDPECVIREGTQIWHQVRQLLRQNVHHLLSHCYTCRMYTETYGYTRPHAHAHTHTIHKHSKTDTNPLSSVKAVSPTCSTRSSCTACWKVSRNWFIIRGEALLTWGQGRCGSTWGYIPSVCFPHQPGWKRGRWHRGKRQGRGLKDCRVSRLNICAVRVWSRSVTGAGLLSDRGVSSRLGIGVGDLVSGVCGVGSSHTSGQCAIRNSGCESWRWCDQIELSISLTSPRILMDTRGRCLIFIRISGILTEEKYSHCSFLSHQTGSRDSQLYYIEQCPPESAVVESRHSLKMTKGNMSSKVFG